MEIIFRFCLAYLLIGIVLPSPSFSRVVVDTECNVTTFYGIPINLTLSDLNTLPFRVRLGREMGEGDWQTTASIVAESNVEVNVVFDDDGKLFRAETHSLNAVGPRGVGVGSSLSDVKAAWPQGRLLYGDEDGRFARYLTGTNVVLGFNPKDLPPEAFQGPPKNVDIPNIKVTYIDIFPHTVSAP